MQHLIKILKLADKARTELDHQDLANDTGSLIKSLPFLNDGQVHELFDSVLDAKDKKTIILGFLMLIQMMAFENLGKTIGINTVVEQALKLAGKMEDIKKEL